VAVGGSHPVDTEPGGELSFEYRPVEGAGGVSVTVDRLGIKRPPHAIDTVDAVQDRAVRVELRITDTQAGFGRTRCAMPELGNDEAGRIDSFETSGAGARVAGVVLEVAERVADREIMGVQHDLSDPFGLVRRPQRRHRLRRRERDVERSDRLRDVFAWSPGVDRSRGHLATEHNLIATRRAWVDEAAVQGLHVALVHDAGKVEVVAA